MTDESVTRKPPEGYTAGDRYKFQSDAEPLWDDAVKDCCCASASPETEGAADDSYLAQYSRLGLWYRDSPCRCRASATCPNFLATADAFRVAADVSVPV